MIWRRGSQVDSISPHAVPEELAALGPMPGDAQLRAWLESYTGGSRVTCAQADAWLSALEQELSTEFLSEPDRAQQPQLAGEENGLEPLSAVAHAEAAQAASWPQEPGPESQSLSSDAQPAAPAHPEQQATGPVLDSAAEDELLERWSAELDAIVASEPPAPELAADSDARARLESWRSADPPALVHEPGAARDDDAPLSAAELSLLEQWSTDDSDAPLSAAPSATPAATSRPPDRTGSQRPGTSSQPAAPPWAGGASAAAKHGLDAESEEIELDPDDLILEDDDSPLGQ